MKEKMWKTIFVFVKNILENCDIWYPAIIIINKGKLIKLYSSTIIFVIDLQLRHAWIDEKNVVVQIYWNVNVQIWHFFYLYRKKYFLGLCNFLYNHSFWCNSFQFDNFLVKFTRLLKVILSDFCLSFKAWTTSSFWASLNYRYFLRISYKNSFSSWGLSKLCFTSKSINVRNCKYDFNNYLWKLLLS